jgi:hypothetical protein
MKECSENLAIPVVFITGEVNLSSLIRSRGLSCHLFDGFPSNRLVELLKDFKKTDIDWDKELQEIQDETAKRIITVEMTLLSERLMPGWIDPVKSMDIYEVLHPLKIFEGHGTVLIPNDKTVGFLWSLPVWESDYPDLNISFPGFEEEIKPELRKDILSFLNNAFLVEWEEMETFPLVQTVHSYLRYMLNPGIVFNISDFLSNHGTPEWEMAVAKRKSDIDQLDRDIEKAGGIENCFIEQLLSDSVDYDDKRKWLTGLFEELSTYKKPWSVGEVKRYRFIPGEPSGIFES